VDRPRLAVVLSGTFDQLIPLVKSGEDGLLSRFALLTIKGNYEWKDANPKSRKSKQIMTTFQETSEKVLALYEVLRQKELSFEFTDEQWIRFDNYFRARKPVIVAAIGDKRGETGAEICNGIVNRLGIIAFRTAMILTVLRYFETGKLRAEPFIDGFKEEIIICSDDDFQTMLEFVAFAEGTALDVLERLPQNVVKAFVAEQDIARESNLIKKYYQVPTPETMKNSIHQTSTQILVRLQNLSDFKNLKLFNIRQVLGEMKFPEKNHRNNGRGYLVIEQCLQ
jgi:hypothetical protein